MGFAADYFNKLNYSFQPLKENPAKDLRFIMVIPCYNEPFLLNTLLSLSRCDRPKSSIEIFVIINEPEGVSSVVQKQNMETFRQLEYWKKQYDTADFRYFFRYYQNIPKKKAGAGYARKMGMDEAAYRFYQLDNSEGIILSMDADAEVAPDYFVSLERHFLENPDTNGVSIYYEHPVSGTDFSSETYQAITYYELYQRYYVQALRYTGFPFALHTIGSCFAVKAGAYIKAGGMNQRKAGEDFYFLHKLIPLGSFYEINETCVYPSPRPSDRVPFGTGTKMIQYTQNPSALTYTYNLRAFLEIKALLDQKEKLYGIKSEQIPGVLDELSPIMAAFLSANDFEGKIKEINQNTAGREAFYKRFYQWFGAFRMLKYLNYSHVQKHVYQPLVQEAVELYARLTGKYAEKNPSELLYYFRGLEKTGNKRIS